MFTNGCGWTSTNLYVAKSQTGQYKRPFLRVGRRSRFNLATISSPLSPELSGQISSSVNKLSSESFCDNWVWFQLVQVPSYKPTFGFRIRTRWSWWWCWKWVWRGWFVESVRDSCFARMMTRRKRLCVSNTCLPHEISMEKAFANCSYAMLPMMTRG